MEFHSRFETACDHPQTKGGEATQGAECLGHYDLTTSVRYITVTFILSKLSHFKNIVRVGGSSSVLLSINTGRNVLKNLKCKVHGKEIKFHHNEASLDKSCMFAPYYET